MESISLNSSVLLEHLAMLLTSTLTINCLLRNFKQGYQYHKLCKTFSKFYRRYYDSISKFQVGLKSLLRQGLSEPEFYGGLVYKLKKIVGSNNFSAQFIKIIIHYKKIDSLRISDKIYTQASSRMIRQIAYIKHLTKRVLQSHGRQSIKRNPP